MTLEEIHAECAEIVTLMVERGFVTPECRAMIKDHAMNDVVHISWGPYDREYKSFHSLHLPAAFAEAHEWIKDQPTLEQRKRDEAIKATAAAVEAWKEVGETTPTDKATKAHIEALMTALSENILTQENTK